MTEEPDSESQKSINLESSLSKVIMTHKYSSQTRAEQLGKNNGVFQQRNDSSGQVDTMLSNTVTARNETAPVTGQSVEI